MPVFDPTMGKDGTNDKGIPIGITNEIMACNKPYGDARNKKPGDDAGLCVV